MTRINVTFYDEIYEQLEERMRKKGSKSIAQTIRELVELGLKIEEAANNNCESDSGVSIVNMLKNNLTWSLEIRLLMRHFIEKKYSTSEDNDSNILKVCKERAENYVKGMLGEEVK